MQQDKSCDCILTPRVQSSQGDKKKYDLTKRGTVPTCQLKFSVEAAILSIDEEVEMLRKRQENLELKVDEILNLLRKPQNGKIVLVVLLDLTQVLKTRL